MRALQGLSCPQLRDFSQFWRDSDDREHRTPLALPGSAPTSGAERGPGLSPTTSQQLEAASAVIETGTWGEPDGLCAPASVGHSRLLRPHGLLIRAPPSRHRQARPVPHAVAAGTVQYREEGEEGDGLVGGRQSRGTGTGHRASPVSGREPGPPPLPWQ